MTELGPRPRRLGGWGFVGESLTPSDRMLEWLESAIGPPGPPVPGTPERIDLPAARPLPGLPGSCSTEPVDRATHARGQGLPDILRLRSGRLPAAPDGVLRPSSAAEIEGILAICAGTGVRVVPWGGGTSVTGGVNAVADPRPAVVIDLGRMSGLERLDEESGLAVLGPGTAGPQVEAELAARGLTLGHYPQSWELATVGGWIAARSSGQESLGYGRIDDLVAGLEVIAPAGRLKLPAMPGSAAGPDLRRLVLGSEGRLGVITRATLRVRPRPEGTEVGAFMLPGFEAGVAAARDLVRAGIPLTLLRLSDGPETEVAMAVGLADSAAGPWVRRFLRLRGVGDGGCLLLVGAAGDPELRRSVLRCAVGELRSHRAVSLGRRPGRHWLRDRFRHPYLRDALLDRGWATDTLETAVPWSGAVAARGRIAAALRDALAGEGERVAVLCHLSHPYPDGSSLYFTFFFRCAADVDATVHRWATVKRAATTALVAAGATVSHHHGVGQWHAPWLEAELGRDGIALLSSAARTFDPDGVLNPHVLLDPVDRLES